MKRNVLCVLLLLATGVVLPVRTGAAQVKAERSQEQTKEVKEQKEAVQKQTDATDEQTPENAKVISGMSILGNQEAPKSLVIVPWKSSEIGDSMNISTILDDSRLPVDKEVFMRELHYFEIRSGRKP